MSSFGQWEIPATATAGVRIRYSPLDDRDRFDPLAWPSAALSAVPGRTGWYAVDVDALALPDGVYEYEFILDGRTNEPVADPFAEELTKFGGYRGLLHIRGGVRVRPPFSWADEFPVGATLRNNHELVMLELPMRWVENAPEETRQVGLGTFERAVFMRLDYWQRLGINAIELLPVQDSADTLNWGYGTRFFFAPDIDLGSPIELRYFIKQCHRRGIRVIFDLVMNHARDCPLAKLRYDDFFLRSGGDEPGRGDDYGANLFRYRKADANGRFAAREFHYGMAEFLIREYHADGFRLDEFKGIDNWEFVQDFRDKAWTYQQSLFPGRPFIVIAEDSWRRTVITHDHPSNPRGRKVVDSMWNFAFRDEVRRAMRNEIGTSFGQPARSLRLRWLVTGEQTWDDYSGATRDGFGDLARAVNYLTSHDVQEQLERRIMNYLLEPLLKAGGFNSSLDDIRWVADHLTPTDGQVATDGQKEAHGTALERLRSAFSLLLTSVGIPMILAGDEFGDVHDLDHTNWRFKMSDPIDWNRASGANNQRLIGDVTALIQLRSSHSALQRNETDLFYFHPTFDANDGERVFAYCRTAGAGLGSGYQVIVAANVGSRDYPTFSLPWHWHGRPVHEVAPPTYHSPLVSLGDGSATLSLAPFQVRVFAVQ